jgi:hypothetical protein
MEGGIKMNQVMDDVYLMSAPSSFPLLFTMTNTDRILASDTCAGYTRAGLGGRIT